MAYELEESLQALESDVSVKHVMHVHMELWKNQKTLSEHNLPLPTPTVPPPPPPRLSKKDGNFSVFDREKGFLTQTQSQ